MAILNTVLGMNVKDTPIKFSPFVVGSTIELVEPPGQSMDLITEGGSFILTENGDFLTTE